jgi:hypothetical protein
MWMGYRTLADSMNSLGRVCANAVPFGAHVTPAMIQAFPELFVGPYRRKPTHSFRFEDLKRK